MKSRALTNPFIISGCAFLVALAIYTLGWSNLYPKLSIELVLFLLGSTSILIAIGAVFHRSNYFSFNSIDVNVSKVRNWTIFISISYIIEVLYMGKIPLLSIINADGYDYTTFGIPTYHVFLVNFNSFCAIYIMHCICSTKIRKETYSLWICYIICLIPPIVIFNRGMFLLIVAGTIFVYLMAVSNMKIAMMRILAISLGILFLFGVAGNIRTDKESVSNIILDISEATDEFRGSMVPDEFFWAYLYISSPLGNVQSSIDEYKGTQEYSLSNFVAFINSEFVPDFISKRTAETFNLEKRYIGAMAPFLTVGSVYAKSYVFFGWLGIFITFLYIIFFNFFILSLIPRRSDYFVTGVAILNCVMFFNIFDNMFSFSGLVLQLFFPIMMRIRFLNARTDNGVD